MSTRTAISIIILLLGYLAASLCSPASAADKRDGKKGNHKPHVPVIIGHVTKTRDKK